MRTLFLIFLALSLQAQTSIFPITATRIVRGTGAPASNRCDSAGEVGTVYLRSDFGASTYPIYACGNTGAGAYGWVLPTAGGSIAWGAITGVLSDQTDLSNALAAKAPLAAPVFTTSIQTPLIYFGGVSASFPMLKRSTTTVQARLADDSAYTDFSLARILLNGLTAFQSGSGTPEGAVTGSVGDIYTRTNGGANTTLYVKESGSATNTGWVALGSGGSMVYPGAGVPNSTGSAWGTSYTVGTGNNNLVQLNGSAQLPAVSAALLTNFPTLNQNTTGTAATITGALAIANTPLTTRGDLLIANATPALARLAVGGANTVLHGGTDPAYSAIVNGDITNGTIDLTTKVTGILPTANGGTANGFFTVTGPATSAKTFTFPNASATVLTTNALVSVAQGGTGIGTLTGVVKGNGTSAFSAAVAGDIYGLWSGTCSASTYLRGDGSCQTPGGSGTVTVVSSGSLGSTQCVTGGGTTTLQTPSSVCTVDSSGNLIAASVATGTSPPSVTAGTAGVEAYGEGTAPSACAAAGVDCIYADSTQHGFMTSFNNGAYLPLIQGPTTSTSGNVASFNATNGGKIQDSGIAAANLVTAASTLTNHGVALGAGSKALGVTAVGSTDKPLVGVTGADPVFSKVTLTNPATAATLTIADNKTLTVSNTLTMSGTDSSAIAFGTGGTVTYTVASGTASLGTGAVSSATCASAVTVTATGTASTDVITAGFNGDPTAVTGYVPLTTGMLTIIAYPTTNNVNFKVCNNTASSITPGAITLNWRVSR